MSRTPRSPKAAQAMLERYAEVDGQIAAIEAERNAAIGAANAIADARAGPLLKELEGLGGKLQVWWNGGGDKLADGKRKSIELGGCIVGSRAGRPSLGLACDEAKAVAALQQRDWAKPLLRTTVKIDRAAVMKSLDGAYAKDLARIGFHRVDGTETFYVEPVRQGGTLAGMTS